MGDVESGPTLVNGEGVGLVSARLVLHAAVALLTTDARRIPEMEEKNEY